MSTTTQDKRLLELQTPLGKDALVIRGIHGREGISHLYSFEIDAFGSNDEPADFSAIVGQPAWVSATLKDHNKRYFHGIVKSFARGARGNFNTAYRMEIVPTFWLLSQRTQSRIFQQMPVPEILKKVLEGLDTDFELAGTFEPRDYCVQYRESDFAFASRIMEEEGIYYFFRHTEDGHTLVLANTPQSHEELPFDSNISYDADRGGMEEDAIIYSWEKQQVLKPGKVTLWDHSFELPHKPLDAQEMVDEDIQVGEVSHKLKLAGNDKLELYDFPGGYAQRFDGIAPAGSERSGDLQKIYEDNHRTAKIRMQQETVNALQITALSDHLNIIPGYKFTLEDHYSDNDVYVITSANVSIFQAGSYGATNADISPDPEISFTCIPYKLPFLPNRITPKPTIYGTQTAVVTGPAGEEIFTDKYGRVKVQFFWDRHGKFDGTSSCWTRVASPWAGKQWGMIHIPRIGQEVIVAFEEGDPDQPIIVGSVYNADTMPGYGLPDNKTMSTFKSRSSPGGGGFNELRFEDKKDSEQIFLHAQKDMHVRVVNDLRETTEKTKSVLIQKDYKEQVDGNYSSTVKGDQKAKVSGSVSLKSDSDQLYKSGSNYAVDAGQAVHIKGGMNVVVEAGTSLTMKVGGNFINLNSGGVFIKGSMVMLNSGGSAGSGSGCSPEAPDPPDEADKGDPGAKQTPPTGKAATPKAQWSLAALSLQRASQSGAAFCDG